MKVLLGQKKIGEYVVLSLDEIRLQNDAQFEDGKLLGVNSDGNLFKSVMTFMINSLKNQLHLSLKQYLR